MKVQRGAVLLGAAALVVAVIIVKPWATSVPAGTDGRPAASGAWGGAGYGPAPSRPATSAAAGSSAVSPDTATPEPRAADSAAALYGPDEAPASVPATPPAEPGDTVGGVLFREGFDDGRLAARGWYDNRNPVIAGESPRGGTGALEMMFAPGARVAVRGGALRRRFPPSEQVFVSLWVRYSPNWRGSGKKYHPHEFHVLTNADDPWIGPSATHLTTYIEHNWQQGGIPRLAITDALNIDSTAIKRDLAGTTERRAVAGCNGGRGDCYQQNGWRNGLTWSAARPEFLPTAGPGYQADWHRLEVEFRLNSVRDGRGIADGLARYWLDGRLLIERTDVLFRTGAHPSMRFDQFVIAPYIGDGSPGAQGLWIDDLVLSTSRVP